MSETEVTTQNTEGSTSEVVPTAETQTQTGETTATTPPVETKPATPAEDPKFASKFAALTRQEKAVREKAAEIERKQAEIATRHAELEALRAKEEAWQRKLVEDPISALEERNIKWDKLTERVLNPETEEQKAFKELQNELKAMKDSLAKEKEEAAAARKAAEEADYNEKLTMWRKALVGQFESGDYPLARQFATVEVVENLIRHTYETEGKVLKDAEALSMVENFYEEKLKGAMSLEKVKSKFSSQGATSTVDTPHASSGVIADASKQDKQPQSGSAKGPAPTLGNKGAPVKPQKDLSEMDEDEKKAYLTQKMKLMMAKK